MHIIEYKLKIGDKYVVKRTECFMTNLGAWIRRKELTKREDVITILNDDEKK